jgi:hypothetical protein
VSHPARPRAKPVAALIGGAIDPLVRKRGLARAELMAWWPEIVGETYAGYAIPERIRWPRDGSAATLVVACDPSLALQLAHETDLIRQRLNAYFGYPAVGAVRIVQRPVGRRVASTEVEPPSPPELSTAMQERLARIDVPLQESLRALGREILARS